MFHALSRLSNWQGVKCVIVEDKSQFWVISSSPQTQRARLDLNRLVSPGSATGESTCIMRRSNTNMHTCGSISETREMATLQVRIAEMHFSENSINLRGLPGAPAWCLSPWNEPNNCRSNYDLIILSPPSYSGLLDILNIPRVLTCGWVAP